MNAETANENLSPAEKFYRSHLRRVSEYQKTHPEKCREKCKKYNARLKEEQPERYQQILQAKKDYYANVRKPKIEALKKQQAEQTANAVAV